MADGIGRPQDRIRAKRTADALAPGGSKLHLPLYLIAGAALGEFRDQRGAVIVPSSDNHRFVSHFGPRGLQRRDRAVRIIGLPSCKGSVGCKCCEASRSIVLSRVYF